MSENQPRLEKMINSYIRIRDYISDKEAEWKEEKAKLKSQQQIIEDHINQMLTEVGTDSFKTSNGVAFKTKKDFVGISDWDEFLSQMLSSIRDAVNEGDEDLNNNEFIQLLNKSISKTGVKEYLEEHKELPQGVKYEVENVIQIRRR